MKDHRDKLSVTTVGLHWLLAVAMIGMIVFGLILEDMPKGDAKAALIWWHKGLGVAILAFALWRFALRMAQGFPAPLSSTPPRQQRMASITHWFLLLGTLFMPISGMMMSMGKNRSIDVLGLFTIPAVGENPLLDQIGHIVHGLGSKLLIAAILLHVVGALKHQFVDKDGTLARMSGRRIPRAVCLMFARAAGSLIGAVRRSSPLVPTWSRGLRCRGTSGQESAMHMGGRKIATRVGVAAMAGALAITVCAIATSRMLSAAEDPWMADDAMRQAFTGVTLEGKYGSGRPFTEVYGKDGRLQYREAAKVIGGRWSVRAGSFCTIYDNDPTGGCFRVKQVGGNCYEFYFVARTEVQAQSDQKKPAWTARGHVVGKPGACAEEHSV